MKWVRRLILSLAVLVLAGLVLAGHYYYKGFYRPAHSSFVPSPSLKTSEYQRLKWLASKQQDYLSQHGFNTRICFLADMHLPSGTNRFFVYDLSCDSVILSGLVAHGCGNKDFSVSPSFSNINGSNCTALGKYRIGSSYRGRFGLAYRLYGLDSTNDQAFNRDIVLHAFNAVPAAETNPYPICNSRGCPMVAPAFLSRLQPLIDASKKPILLSIFK